MLLYYTRLAPIMAKTISQVATDYLASFRRNTSYTHLKQNPYPAFLAVGLVGSVIVGRLAWEDYQAFLSYGPGGVPYNVVGWLVTNFFRAIGINTLDVRKLEKDPDQRTWLGDLKPRDGGRPVLGRHPIPQRQLDQIPAAEIRQVSVCSAPHRSKRKSFRSIVYVVL